MGKQLGWEEHPKLHLPDAMKTEAPCPPPPAQTHRGCRRTRPQGGGCITSPACPSTPTHHTWMLGLERYELPQGGHVGRLVGGHWRWGWVQDVMVAGDDGGECLVGDGKLLHGTCLNQLWGETERKTKVRHPCPLPRASKGPCAPRNLHYSGLGYPQDSGHSRPRLSPGVPRCDSPGVGGSRAGSAVR